jgi:signal transduction histidine kinase
MFAAFMSSLRLRFLALLLLAVLPGFGVTGYFSLEQRQQAVVEAHHEALQLVRSIAAHHAQLLETERQRLTTITELPEVVGGDAVACQRRLANLRRQYPHYVNVSVVTAEGQTACSALPFTPPVSVGQRLWFWRVMYTRAFAVGDYQVGMITGQATLNVALPVLGERHQIRAIIVAALDIGWLNQRLAEAQPPEGTTLSLIDRQGTIVAHYPDAPRWVGQSLPEAPIVRTVLAQGEGTADSADLDGVPRLLAFKPLVGTGPQDSLSIIVGVDKAVVFAEADQVLRHSLIGLGIAVLLAMAVTWMGANWLILRPIKGLVRATGQLAAGDLSARTGLAYDHGEIGQLAQAFDDMAHTLEQRQAEAARVEEKLATYAERLKILREVDRALIAEEKPEAIAAAALPPLRDLLGVPRAIVNLFDLAAGEVEWLAAVGRRRLRVGPGIRYSIQLMGDVEALRRGEPQVIDVHALPPGPEVGALLASGVHVYMVVPMIAGGELIGALSFGGATGPFPDEQVSIAQEAATQFAIAIAQARLHERVQRQAAELDLRVRERTAELVAANRELEAFSYAVSHDLRAPLRGIDGFSHALLEDYSEQLDAEGQEYLHRIRGATKWMAELIDALLEFSRIARTELHRETVDLSSLVQRVGADLQQMQPERQVALQITDGLEARGDARLLRVLLQNLLGNAWKFTARTPTARIEVGRIDQVDGTAVFFVADNGAGFDMAYADKLFGAFQRLHRAHEFPGTGIGLATVQRIIQRHGGRVWAQGAVGRGATFYFTLVSPP